jgi:predicted SAM-dependent methyltransferase
MTLKKLFGDWLIPLIPVNHHVSNHIRQEMAAKWISILHKLHPSYRVKIKKLKKEKDLLVNVACGPHGKSEWVNLDLYKQPNLTLRADTRRQLPLADDSCLGIHVEHFLEHLNPTDDRILFLRECRRCLQPDGILRVIAPDAELYLRAYLEPGWESLNQISSCGDYQEAGFRTKIEAVNYIFHQEGEHFGGYDGETVEVLLKEAGFRGVSRLGWRLGNFPGGCIDREQHRHYSLYFEAEP